MKVIAFASRKGGSGKSTLAAHVSIHADSPKTPALLVDVDPQGSLTFWHELRAAETPVLVRCEARELPNVIDAARKDGIEWVLIDSAPHHEPTIADTMRASDLVVIPLRPAVFDIAAVAATLDMARALGKSVLPVINSAPPRRGVSEASVVAEARDALIGLRTTPWAGQVTTRAVFAHALASGQAVQEFEPASSAAREIADLWTAIRRAVGKRG